MALLQQYFAFTSPFSIASLATEEKRRGENALAALIALSEKKRKKESKTEFLGGKSLERAKSTFDEASKERYFVSVKTYI